MNISDLEKYFSGRVEIGSSSLRPKLFLAGVKQKQCECCGLDTWMGKPIPLELHHINGNSRDNSLKNLQILCANCHAFTPNFRASSQRRRVIKKSIEEILTVIQNSYNARHCLIQLGYQPKGANYKRIDSIMEKYGVKFRLKTEEEKLQDQAKIENSSRIYWDEKRQEAAKEGRIIPPRKRTAKFASMEEAIFARRRVAWPSKIDLLEMVWKEPVSSVAKRLGVTDNAVRKWAQQYQIPVPPVGYWAKFNHGHFEICAQIKKDLFAAFNLP